MKNTSQAGCTLKVWDPGRTISDHLPVSKALTLSLVLELAVAFVFAFPLFACAAPQVISPSTAPNTHKRNMEAAANGDTATNVEPSMRLLSAMDAMIPFEVIGSEFEDPLRGVARKFLTGSANDAIKDIEKMRATRSDIPPAPVLIANMLFAAGDQAKCRLWLEKATKENPGHPTAFLGFARFSISQKRISDADAMLEKVTRLVDEGDATWTEEQKKLFRIEYLDIKTDILINRQELEEAKTNLAELRGLLENNGKIPIRLAQVEFDLGNIEASLFQLREAVKLSKGIRKPEIIIGEWFMRKKDAEESAKWIKLAAKEYPNEVSVQIDYARWLLQNENFAETGDAVANAERLGGEKYIIGYLKGQLAFAQRSYEAAETHFDSVLRGKPNDADATNMLALCLIESADESKHGRALELAVMNLRLYPKSPTATATLGWIYYRTGKTAEAEQAFRAVIASRNLEPAAAYYVASYLAKREDNLGAKNLLEQAVSSTEYFMFRRAAEELLSTVNAKIPKSDDPADPANSATPDNAPAGENDDGKRPQE